MHAEACTFVVFCLIFFLINLRKKKYAFLLILACLSMHAGNSWQDTQGEVALAKRRSSRPLRIHSLLQVLQMYNIEGGLTNNAKIIKFSCITSTLSFAFGNISTISFLLCLSVEP